MQCQLSFVVHYRSSIELTFLENIGILPHFQSLRFSPFPKTSIFLREPAFLYLDFFRNVIDIYLHASPRPFPPAGDEAGVERHFRVFVQGG
jgi:hypothetical protein